MSRFELDKVLANVSRNRRGFLKTLLVGSAAAAAAPLLTSRAVAAAPGPGDEGQPPKADGTCNDPLVLNKKKGVCMPKKKKEE